MWLATMASNLGAMIQSVGAGWLMTTLSASSLMVALVQAAASLPVMLLGLWAGAVADNFDRRRVMLACQIFMFIVSAALTALALAGMVSPLVLLVATFLLGCGTAMVWPAMQASVVDFVPRALMPQAVALNAMGVNIARSAGPALGGALIAAFGATLAFAVNALSYLAPIVALARWRPAHEPRVLPRERLNAAVLAGLRYAAMSPVLARLGVRAVIYGLFASAAQALMPLVARLVGGGALGFGLLLGAFGLGAVAGALSSARVRARWTTETILRNAALLGAAGTALAGVSPWFGLTLLAMAMTGASWLLTLSTFNVTIQLSIPRWVTARGLSLYQTALFGGVALGSWAFGALAERGSLAAALLLAAGGLALVSLIGLRYPVHAATETDLGPRGGWDIPDTALPVALHSGPIIVTVEHRIGGDNALAFLAAMQERSRILRRDGARRWSLARDLADPQLWIERYQCPTWLDYVLLNQRRTKADAANHQRLAALRLPGTGLVVHRGIERQSGALP